MTQSEMEKKLNDMAAELATAKKQIAEQSTVKPKKYYAARPQKFWTTCDRFVHGRYVRASPEYPALITFEDDVKIPVLDNGKPEDGTLIPVKEGKPEAPKTEGLRKPYAEIRRGPDDRADDTGGRPSDTDPAARA